MFAKVEPSHTHTQTQGLAGYTPQNGRNFSSPIYIWLYALAGLTYTSA